SLDRRSVTAKSECSNHCATTVPSRLIGINRRVIPSRSGYSYANYARDNAEYLPFHDGLITW
ncbi:hypothetical protein SK128_025694, partial [Halocaridina rubra]